jgi:spore maturation protein CgeB
MSSPGETKGSAVSQKSPRILVVGDFMWPWYEEACANALEVLGCKIERFGWLHDFRHFVEGQSEPLYYSLWHHIQSRLYFGPAVWRVNRRLIRTAREFKPDIVWFYNVQLISAGTVYKLRRLLPNAVLCQYANDDPFSKTAKFGLWRNFLASMRYFDLHFVYRHNNITDHQRCGAKEVHLLRSYFIPEVDYPEPQENIPEHFKCDVVFAGHYEDDGRVDMLEAICKAGFKLNLFGGGWATAPPNLSADSPLHALFPITPMTGADYRYAICGAKVALCFLSTLNNDSYTRRSFQIPAMKTAMLSEYTADLASMFIPDVEAVFFSSQKELLNKLQTLLADDQQRAGIAEAGYARVYADGHDIRGRMVEWLEYTLNKS